MFLISKHGGEKVNEAFTAIQDLIIRSLQAVSKTIINDRHCFELYGFDILFDDALKPWLIEINSSPSMTANTPQDYDGKLGLLEDTFTTLDLEKILKGDEEQIGGFDMIVRGNPVRPDPKASYSTFLGCYNNRQQQLKRLAKQVAARLNQVHASEKQNQF